MTAALLDRLARTLRSAPVHIGETTSVAIAFSGGMDSSVLLAAVCRLGISRRLRCIHVDHQLQQASADWSQFCRAAAQTLGVEFVSRTVECSVGDQGIEAAARAARYSAFADELRPGEVLLSAHHADDQLETLMYRWVRGTGVDGLRGIRAFEPLGRGYLMRPFLHESRAAIVALADEFGVQWLEDPSNQDVRFDRNFLRHNVLPAIVERWPQAGQAASRLAAAADDARELAEALALADLAGIETPDRLPLSVLTALSPARQRNVLRHAVGRVNLPMPDAAALARVGELIHSAADSAVVTWSGGEARRYGEALFLRSPHTHVPATELQLQPGQSCQIARGWLELEPAPAPALPDAWVRNGLSVRFRVGGERFRPAGAGKAVPLREWMRTHTVLPWMRDEIPLVYYGRELAAVADLSISEAAAQAAGSARGWRVVWRERPRIS